VAVSATVLWLFLQFFLLGPQAFVTTLSAAGRAQRVPRVALPADLDVQVPGLCLCESRHDKYLCALKTYLLKVLEAYNDFGQGLRGHHKNFKENR
jgi:hypothetical protein